MDKYTSNDIVTFKSSAEACRSNPAFYVGPLDSPQAISFLLQEAMCMALESAAERSTTQIRITRDVNHSLNVWDNGPSLIDPLSTFGNKPVYESLMTMMYACREMKQHKREYCSSGIVATNGLSTWLKLDITWDGHHWHQSYSAGEPDAPIQLVGAATCPFRQISFLPDATIFPNIELDLLTFQSWFLTNSCELNDCEVLWVDRLKGVEIDLRKS